MKKAFTLIELLVVVLIIGILAAIALPQYQKAVEKARAMQAVTVVKAIGDAQEVYYLANGQYADNFDDLGVNVPGEDFTYRGILKRKKYDVFDFGAKAVSSFNDCIAVSNRWESTDAVGQTDGKAHYYIMRFAQDSNLYCFPGGTLQDPYGVCKTLSGGSSTTKKDHAAYIIR